MSKYPGISLRYGSTSNKAWDVAVELPSGDWHIQTKTVSAYSQTRRLSPIHHGWDELYIVYLNHAFQPVGFWIITDTSIVDKLSPLKNMSGPKLQDVLNATVVHPLFGANRIDEFNQRIALQIPNEI